MGALLTRWVRARLAILSLVEVNESSSSSLKFLPCFLILAEGVACGRSLFILILTVDLFLCKLFRLPLTFAVVFFLDQGRTQRKCRHNSISATLLSVASSISIPL